MKKNILIILIIAFSFKVSAQMNEIYDSNIATLQVVANDNWLALPIMNLYGDEKVDIDFDDLTHEYQRYTYSIQHCEADWTPSEELFASDFIDGFSEDNTIDDVQESINTNVLYTHYHLTIPNEKCRIKLSGNYKLNVYNRDGDIVLTACFWVLDKKVGTQLEATTNTDIDINDRHQQVSMQVRYGNLTVTDPKEEIKTVVMQNGRWSTARVNTQPQYIMPDGLRWHHHKDLIFTAGNEYRKFEILDVSHPTMGIESIDWDGSYYHVYPFIAEPRPHYLYDEDADGAFYVRNSDNIENNYSSEYVYVHYQVMCPEPVRGKVYINGKWTEDRFIPLYEMQYDVEKRCYTAAILQKQGYYNYQILWVDERGNIQTMPTDGDYYQTEKAAAHTHDYQDPEFICLVTGHNINQVFSNHTTHQSQ